MAIIDGIFQRFGYISEKQFNTRVIEAVKTEIDKVLPHWLAETADAARWTMPDTSIFATQADMYRLSPILGTAIEILGNDIGTAKLNVKRMVGEEVRDIPNHPFEFLMRKPNPVDSGIEFIQNTASNKLLNGNSIWWLNKENADSIPIEIWTIPFSAITPIPDRKLYIDHFDYFPGNGKTIRLETWEIVHFKSYNPNNRFIGLSPLESLAMTLQGDLAMRKTNTVNYAEYGGAPQSILAFKEFVNEPAWSGVKQEVREAAKKNEMMMLRGVGDGISWLQRALNNKDMDFIAGLSQNMSDVFNRMCPGLIAMLSENATEANALAARATYSEKTLWPLMETISQKITSDILPAYGRKLIAQFEDPRVVDKAIKLQERSADEKIMTVEELRKEYKQLEPFGDERDDLLLAQITAQTGKPEPPVVVQSPVDAPPAEDMPVDETPTDGSTEPVKADLMRWKRYSLRTFGKAEFTKFEGRDIPEPTARAIRARLGACKNTLDVAGVFEDAVKFYRPVNPIVLLAGEINRAVEAMEK
jgi:HK97 family phage portal protein